MIEVTQLLKRIEMYCEKHGIEETTFGFRAVNDGKLVARLRGGKSITLKTYTKVAAYLKARPSRVPVAHAERVAS